MNPKRLFTGGLLTIALLACAGVDRKRPPPNDDWVQELPDLDLVDPTDGVDAREAKTIARAIFWDHLGACGGPDKVVLHGRTWVISLRFGATGARIKDTIEVDAKTGGVSLGEHRFPDYAAFRKGRMRPVNRDD
jgi:hypothetical protein